jgi:hypothetical protein
MPGPGRLDRWSGRAPPHRGRIAAGARCLDGCDRAELQPTEEGEWRGGRWAFRFRSGVVGGGGLAEGEAASGGGASGLRSPVVRTGGLRASVTASCRRGGLPLAGLRGGRRRLAASAGACGSG